MDYMDFDIWSEMDDLRSSVAVQSIYRFSVHRAMNKQSCSGLCTHLRGIDFCDMQYSLGEEMKMLFFYKRAYLHFE